MNHDFEDIDLDADLDGFGEGVSNAAAATETNIAAPAADVAEVTTPARKRAGRKFDSTGRTNLGKARLIYAANPNLSVKELKQKFEAELKVSDKVAQTYASLVRNTKAKNAAAATAATP